MTQKKNILIADDDKNLVEFLSTRLKSLGYSVKAVYDGIDAVASVVSDPPNLIVLDVDMPGANGLSVCEKIAEYHIFDPLPVILLTGRIDSKSINTANQAGAYYVCKNDKTWEKLEPLIENLLNTDEDIQEFDVLATG